MRCDPYSMQLKAYVDLATQILGTALGKINMKNFTNSLLFVNTCSGFATHAINELNRCVFWALTSLSWL